MGAVGPRALCERRRPPLTRTRAASADPQLGKREKNVHECALIMGVCKRRSPEAI